MTKTEVALVIGLGLVAIVVVGGESGARPLPTPARAPFDNLPAGTLVVADVAGVSGGYEIVQATKTGSGWVYLAKMDVPIWMQGPMVTFRASDIREVVS